MYGAKEAVSLFVDARFYELGEEGIRILFKLLYNVQDRLWLFLFCSLAVSGHPHPKGKGIFLRIHAVVYFHLCHLPYQSIQTGAVCSTVDKLYNVNF